jgi:hypothetical protein
VLVRDRSCSSVSFSMTSRKPIIGVTRCSRLDDYRASVEQSGGAVWVLEVTVARPRRAFVSAARDKLDEE